MKYRKGDIVIAFQKTTQEFTGCLYEDFLKYYPLAVARIAGVHQTDDGIIRYRIGHFFLFLENDLILIERECT